MSGLTNSRSLGYTGVKAKSPPNITRHSFDPTTRDYFNFSLGDIWINNGTTSVPLFRVWMLVAQRANVATWVLFISGSGGDISQLTASDGTIAIPVLGNITFPAGHNIVSNVNPNFSDQFTVNVTNTITLGDLAPANNIITAISSTNTTLGVQFLLQKSVAGGVITNTSDIGSLFFQGFDGAAFQTGALIKATATGTIAAGKIPTNLRFFTKSDTAAAIAERMVINSEGDVTINAPTSGTALTVIESSPAALALDVFGSVAIENSGDLTVVNGTTTFGDTENDISAAVAQFRKQRGVVATPVLVGDGLGSLFFAGYDANTQPGTAGFTSGAAIESVVTAGTIGGGGNQRIPANLQFFTHPDAVAAGPTQRMVINANGSITINSPDAGAGSGLQINPPTGGTLALDVNGSIAVETPGDLTVINGTTTFGDTDNNASSPVAQFRKQRGAIPAAVQVGDALGSLFFVGYDGNTQVGTAGFTTGAAIESFVTAGTIDGGGNQRLPADLEFFTHPDAIGANPTQRMVIASTGVITVNAADAAATSLVVTGGIKSITSFGQAGNGTGIALLIDNTGLLCTVASSERYKQNIEDMGEKSSAIYDLRPVTFNYKKQPKLPAWGLIAEQVDEVFPDLVVYEAGVPETVKYHDLVPLLLNELQKLNKRVNILESKLSKK